MAMVMGEIIMEDITCLFCGKSSDQIVIEENGYKGRKCIQCGLIFISPRLTPLEIQNLYAKDQSHVSAESHISGSFAVRLHARHNLRIIKKFIDGGSILEIGAGAGYFLNEARKEGFEVYGIELNPIQADFIKSKLGIPCEESEISSHSFGKKKFDIIYHCDVISHFYDPIITFENINEKLNKNGIMVFETGNFGDVKDKYYKLVTKFQYPDHLFFFSENSLKELLLRTGFDVIKIYKYSINPLFVVEKYLQRIITIFKSKDRIKETSKNEMAASLFSNISKCSLRELIKNVYAYSMYLLCYKIGYVMPKKQRIQTVIIVARKRNS